MLQPHLHNKVEGNTWHTLSEYKRIQVGIHFMPGKVDGIED